MQNNTFQLPVDDNEQARLQASPVETTPASVHEIASRPRFVNSQLGQLSVEKLSAEVEEYGQQILESDRNNDWREASTLPERKLTEIGGSIENERNRVESESNFGLAA